jgi:C4-dicarboxylate-specific signal transduction histidine kinase
VPICIADTVSFVLTLALLLAGSHKSKSYRLINTTGDTRRKLKLVKEVLMILLRSLLFVALTLGAVWYFMVDPDRQAQIASIEQNMQIETQFREQALTTTVENFEQAATLISRSKIIADLVETRDQVPVNSAFVTVVTPADSMTDEDAVQRLSDVESLTGLNGVRIMRDTGETVPDIAPSPTLEENGSWNASVAAAFDGQIGKSIFTDSSGTPVVGFFVPYSDPTTNKITAIVIAQAALTAEQARWQASKYRIVAKDASGGSILENSIELGPEIITVEQDMPALNASISAAAAMPEPFGPWVLRSAATALVAILGFFLWEQQRSRQRAVSQLAEARHLKAVKLEEEVAERTTELGEVKDQLAVSESLAMIGQVSASLGQEISKPLAALKKNAETASQFIDRGNPGLAQQTLQKMPILTDRISRIVGDLRGFVSTAPYQIEPVSMRPVVHDAAIQMLDRCPSLGDYFFIEIAEDVPDQIFVRADKTRLSQVISTLLSSSWDACRDEEQPELVISIEQSEDDVVVSVDHNGPADLHHAAQGSDTARVAVSRDAVPLRDPDVGFTIAKSFVEGMGGKLDYKSSALGGNRSEIVLAKFRSGAQ